MVSSFYFRNFRGETFPFPRGSGDLATVGGWNPPENQSLHFSRGRGAEPP